MLDFILVIMIWSMSWFFSGLSHEDDLRRMCEKNGIAKGISVEFKCSEMKQQSRK